MRNLIMLACLGLCWFSTVSRADGQLSPNYRFDSKQLGYALQYRVYLPDGVSAGERLPTIYLTDGQRYIQQGHAVEILDQEIASGRIKPVLAVFVDSRNPDDLSQDRRNEQFMCNRHYVSFFLNELLPTISGNFPVSELRQDRVIAGISFGGLNAGCFGLLASDYFAGIGMQSPASDKHLKVLSKAYKKSDTMPVKMFFSIGTKHDNTQAARKFHQLLQQKGYQVNYIEVPFAHEWANWRPLFDDLLQTFFATGSNNTAPN